MTNHKITSQRLINQKLAYSRFNNPVELLKYMCCVQAQDYPNSKWALGVRLPEFKENEVEECLKNGRIIRTWIMRGTLQLVAAEDLRWLLNLVSPRIISSIAGSYRRLELDEIILSRAKEILVRELVNHKELNRKEIYEIFNKESIAMDGIRLSFILQRAILDQVIITGTKQRTDQTFKLMHDRIPTSKFIERDEAIAEIITRYFRSRGPATIRDFTWWSGLSFKDAKNGLDIVSKIIIKENKDGIDYFAHIENDLKDIPENSTYLLPAFDEYLISYRDRSASLDSEFMKNVILKNGLFNPTIVFDGRVIGTWKRKIDKENINIVLSPFNELNTIQKKGIEKARDRFIKYMEKI
jgi:hypothetical protein